MSRPFDPIRKYRAGEIIRHPLYEAPLVVAQNSDASGVVVCEDPWGLVEISDYEIEPPTPRQDG